MRLSFPGSLDVSAPRTFVWQRLMDPQFVAAAAPGVERVEQVDDTHFKVFLGFGLGALKLHFNLDVELFGIAVPQHVTMRAQGNAPGSTVDVTTVIELVEAAPGRTTMNWQADCEVGGMLAGMGGHLLEGTARRITEQFWLDFAGRCARAA